MKRRTYRIRESSPDVWYIEYKRGWFHNRSFGPPGWEFCDWETSADKARDKLDNVTRPRHEREDNFIGKVIEIPNIKDKTDDEYYPNE